MKRHYNGPDKCAGCGTPGSDRPRRLKNDICLECKEYIRLGKAFKVSNDFKEDGYVHLFQHYYAFRWNEVNEFLHSLLTAFNNPYMQGGQIVDPIKYSSGNNGKHYTIPRPIYEAICKFMPIIDKTFNIVRKEEEMIPEKAALAVKELKNEIFNAGVEQGKDMLAKLNSGSLSLDDFNKYITKY